MVKTWSPSSPSALLHSLGQLKDARVTMELPSRCYGIYASAFEYLTEGSGNVCCRDTANSPATFRSITGLRKLSLHLQSAEKNSVIALGAHGHHDQKGYGKPKRQRSMVVFFSTSRASLKENLFLHRVSSS